ncbi:hypothetical protein CEXT_319871 [Caerostris extrusa]|uniref:Uncharacterized protein n=1 Tax=Caerostris extrusa TaxID=172846 RepID=A0AAV4YBV0_CAEEX|nr:hypothetical protein CEXT_319871 [Caerostris extrusa]
MVSFETFSSAFSFTSTEVDSNIDSWQSLEYELVLHYDEMLTIISRRTACDDDDDLDETELVDIFKKKISQMVQLFDNTN